MLPGWTMTLYDEQGTLMTSSVTNIFGKANFRFLTPGKYTVCETQQTSWTNTQPGRLNANFGNQPCYTFTANPAEIVYLRFGNFNGVSSASAESRPEAYDAGIVRVPDSYQDADDAGYSAPANDTDLDLTQPDDPAQTQQVAPVFLPLISGSSR